MPRRGKLTSVYPGPAAVAVLGGYRPKWLNLAIENWAYVLAGAAAEVEGVLTAPEWALLGAAFRLMRPKIEPRNGSPQVALVGVVEDAATVHGGLFPAKARASLIKKLYDLDYVKTWAVIYALQWALDEGHADAEAEWWTVQYRSAHAGGGEE